MWYKNDNFFGLIFIIAGTTLLIWGVSYFVFPLFLSLSGLLLINQGLQLRRMPTLTSMVKHWLLQFK